MNPDLDSPCRPVEVDVIDADARDRLEAIARSMNLGGNDRHVLLCAMQTTPRCCSREASGEVWEYLKRRVKDLGLDSPPPPWRGRQEGPPPETPAGRGRVLRSKVDCLRVCEQGPIAVVYPEGVWYAGVTCEVMERILLEHVLRGQPVSEHAFAVAPLGPEPS
jgi:(2Fe-2S) ferredoxin